MISLISKSISANSNTKANTCRLHPDLRLCRICDYDKEIDPENISIREHDIGPYRHCYNGVALGKEFNALYN